MSSLTRKRLHFVRAERFAAFAQKGRESFLLDLGLLVFGLFLAGAGPVDLDLDRVETLDDLVGVGLLGLERSGFGFERFEAVSTVECRSSSAFVTMAFGSSAGGSPSPFSSIPARTGKQCRGRSWFTSLLSAAAARLIASAIAIAAAAEDFAAVTRAPG